MPEGSGGETRFTALDISVRPMKGRALVWPSVLNEDPYRSDSRSVSESAPLCARERRRLRPNQSRTHTFVFVLLLFPRMFHEAVKVEAGTKYAANHWIHQNDFRTANLWGCSGSFS